MSDEQPISASTIRPGILVVLKSSIDGGVTYQRVDLDADDTITDSAKAVVQRWETTKIVDDPDENERAVSVRRIAVGRVRRSCAQTSFGFICPSDYEGALDAAIRDARRRVDEFNATAKHTRIGVYVLKGRIASDDAEAARAITKEIASLVKRMDDGIAAFDVDAIRAAAKRAREIGGMLSEENKVRVDGAIKQARDAARMIVKRIEGNAEDKATVLADIQRGEIDSARIAFLDMSDSIASDALPSVEAQRFFEMMADPNVDPEDVVDAQAGLPPIVVPEIDTDLDAVTPAADDTDDRPSTSTQDAGLAALRTKQAGRGPSAAAARTRAKRATTTTAKKPAAKRKPARAAKEAR